MMYEISSRRAGKTTRMVQHAKANNGIILVFCEVEKRRICREHEFPADRILTLWDLKNEENLRGRFLPSQRENLYIDNLEFVLNSLLNQPGFVVAGFSMLGD